MNEEVSYFNGVRITWRSKPRKYDCRHVVVVFSGFGGASEFTYDFINAMGNLWAEVIWIKDDFGGHASYYTDISRDHKVSCAVNGFIRAKLSDRNLTVEDCTLLGASKGGSAALSYGFEFGYKNVIAAVPQLLRASYLKSYWPKNYAHLFPYPSSEQHQIFDAEILRSLHSAETDVNLYLISSRADTQYETEIEPFLKDFERLDNFNLIMADSPLAYQHNVITSLTTPIILSLLSLIGQGMAPYFNATQLNFQETPAKHCQGVSVVDLRKASFVGSTFFPEGVGLRRGISCPDYTDVDYKLVLVSETQKFEIPLAKGNNSDLSKEFFDGNFVRYDKAWFCTAKHAGIDLSHLPSDTYTLFLGVRMRRIDTIEPLQSRVQLSTRSTFGAKKFTLESGQKETVLTIT